jgi:hypothetical protein
MKKYLMTGIAALAMCFGFTSCSHDVEPVSQEDLNQLEAQKIVNNYNQAFLRYVGGNIAANQTWGFGGYSTFTRSINVNGNLWEDCPAVGSTEEADVLAYLATLQTKEKNPVRLQNYFVTQIHKGDEVYYNQDNGYVGVGSDKMNNLHIAMSENLTINNGALSAEGPTAWDHINNFNAGTCNDWGAGDADGQGNTLVLNGGTFDFAYQGADDSKYHNRWCSIDGKDVPKTGGGNYAGYYYICFDFEQNVDGKTAAYFRDENNNPQNIQIPGAYHSVAEATGQKFTFNGKEYVFGQTANCSEWRIDNVINGNMIVDPTSTYTDWIIRLVKAEPEGDPDPDNVCIIAEDLSAEGDTDFDFNDVVFTVTYTSASTATVTLYAAGGTLPLKVAGQEVHAKFGYAEPNEKGLYKMINTGAKADVNNVAPVTFDVTSQKSSRGNDITIMVDKGKKNDQGVHVENWIELTATGGEPAAKLCVGTDYATSKKWCDERESIKTKYPAFSEWVANSPTLIWWK